NGRTPTKRQLIAIFLANLALVYTHPYGLPYSGAMLVGYFMFDLSAGRIRRKIYGAIIAAWICFAAWLPWYVHQVNASRPKSWIEQVTLPQFIRDLDLTIPVHALLIIPAAFLVAALLF